MTRKPMLQAGTTTWAAIAKTRCYCGHVMANHQVWANQLVCLESSCHKVRPEDVPEEQVAVRQCWSYEVAPCPEAEATDVPLD